MQAIQTVVLGNKDRMIIDALYNFKLMGTRESSFICVEERSKNFGVILKSLELLWEMESIQSSLIFKW